MAHDEHQARADVKYDPKKKREKGIRRKRSQKETRNQKTRPRRRDSNISSESKIKDTLEDKRRSRRDTLRVNVSSLLGEAISIQNRTSGLEGLIEDLPNRLSRVRDSKYLLMNQLEPVSQSLSSRWNTQAPKIKDDTWRMVSSLKFDLDSISNKIGSISLTNDSELSVLESRLGNIRGDISRLRSFVDSELNEFQNDYDDLNSDLLIAESTTELLANPSFEWKFEEHPVIAIRAHHIDDDVHGIMTLTNQRFIFEGEKEVVVKKTLFIITEKKMVREVIIDQPVGAVDNIESGKVGFFKGKGIFVRFDPDIGLKEIKFDTRGEDGNQLIRFFEYINSGQADKDLMGVLGEDYEEDKEAVPVVCPLCSAPYRTEVYRGQTSVTCKYCGTVIHL